MVVVSLRSVTLAAVVAAALVAFGCADDDGGPETPGETSLPAASQTVSPTPAATGVSSDDERLLEILNLGDFELAIFLALLWEAVEENDAQFLIAHTHFAEYECQSLSGFPAEPEECYGSPGHTLPAISSGAWQSDGGYWSEVTYAAAIRDVLSGPDADDASVYTIGQMTLGDDESPDAVDVVVAGLGSLLDREPPEGFAMSLAIAERDGEFVITEFDWAKTELVPDFYEWWTDDFEIHSDF